MVDVVCPCCDGKGTIDEPPVYLTAMQRKIYDAVRFSKKPLGGEGIVNIVYADRQDGGPDYALKSVHVQILKMNQRLAPAGQRIRAGRGGYRESYRLERI